MRLEHVSLQIGQNSLLRDMSLSFVAGEMTFLVGPSGGGKTSLLKVLSLETLPTSGEYILGDFGSVKKMSSNSLIKARRMMGVIFQDYRLLPTKTVAENVAFAMESCGYGSALIARRVPEVLSEVGLLAKRDKFPRELSGGEQQRVAIARSLIHDPTYIIADEPTGNLDPEASRRVFDILLDLSRRGKTVIVATHDRERVDALRQRVVHISHGKLVWDAFNALYPA